MNNQSSSQEYRFSKIESGINSNNQYHNLLLQAHVGIVIFKGPDLVIELANKPLLALWGKTNNVIGKSLLKALPEIKGTTYPDLLLDVLNNGVTHYANENSAILIRNGVEELVYFNFVYQPFYESDGSITGVMAIANEVSDQVLARKKVEDSEVKFRNLVEQTPTPLLILKGEDMVLEVANDSLFKLWNVGSEALGKKFLEILPEMKGQGFFSLLQNVYKTGVTHHGKEVPAFFLRSAGNVETVYFNFVYQPYFERDKTVSGVIVLATDVSEQVAAKQQLLESEERLRIATESAGMGTWDYNPSTNTILCSSRTKELFGFKRGDDVRLEMAIEAIVEEDKDRVVKAIRYALDPASGGNYDIEYSLVNFYDKTERTIKAKGKAFFDASGKPIRFIGTALDITDQRKASQILEKKIDERTYQLKEVNERLERSNEELEQFAHVASHDMKEPVRKISLYVSRIHEHKDELPAEVINYIDKIQSSVDRLKNMVEGVLEYSTVNATKEEYESIDLQQIIKNIEEDIELVITQKKAVINCSDLPKFRGAAFLIYQLLYNLITNSLKFSKENVPPVISISGNYVTSKRLSEFGHSSSENHQWAEIIIKDNGIGFDQEYGEAIFNTFTRLNSRSRYEGTGMGLALVKRIVLRHNGFITAISQHNQGATFMIWLPAND